MLKPVALFLLGAVIMTAAAVANSEDLTEALLVAAGVWSGGIMTVALVWALKEWDV